VKKFIPGEDLYQLALFPERLDDSIAEDNPVRFLDLFVNRLDLLKLGFDKVEPAETRCPHLLCLQIAPFNMYNARHAYAMA
jgi:transposase